MKDLIKKKIFPSIGHPIIKRINKLSNIHKDEECYLIADGASIKYFDLEKFSDKISIGCGLINFHKDYPKLNLKYCVLTEPFWLYPYTRDSYPPYKIIKNYVGWHYRKKSMKDKHLIYFVNPSNIFATLSLHYFWAYRYWNSYTSKLNELAKKFDCFTGTFRSSISLAIHLGFRKIYLVGFDYTHNPMRGWHWYENKPSEVLEKQYDYEKEFLLAARKYIDICTITLDGDSKFIDSIKYEKFFNTKINYKENTDIMTKEDYSIIINQTGRVF